MGLFLSGKDLNKKRLTFPKGERNLMADWLQTWTLTSAPSWVSSQPIYPVQFGLTSLHNHISAFLVAQMEKTLPAMQETRVWSLGREDPLEKEMATHSNIFAWRIPWTEEPGGLQSMGSQRLEHDWATITFTRRKKDHLWFSLFTTCLSYHL